MPAPLPVGVALLRTLTAQWPYVPSIGQSLQPFTGNGDASILEINSQKGRTTPNKQTYVVAYVFNPSDNAFQKMLILQRIIKKAMLLFKGIQSILSFINHTDLSVQQYCFGYN